MNRASSDSRGDATPVSTAVICLGDELSKVDTLEIAASAVTSQFAERTVLLPRPARSGGSPNSARDTHLVVTQACGGIRGRNIARCRGRGPE